jgi:hypothetical protein
MAAPKNTNKTLSFQFPPQLTLKDLLTVVGFIVTLTLAWGAFSTRLTVVEREIVALQSQNISQGFALEKIQQQVGRLSRHQQDDELIIDQIFTILRRQTPQRRALD